MADLALRRIPHLTISDRGIVERLASELEQHPVPTLVFTDRFVGDGMSRGAATSWQLPIDQMQDPPGWRIIRRDGVAYAVLWAPSGAQSRATSR